jgi:hypothetical protein
MGRGWLKVSIKQTAIFHAHELQRKILIYTIYADPNQYLALSSFYSSTSRNFTKRFEYSNRKKEENNIELLEPISFSPFDSAGPMQPKNLGS